MKILKIYKIIDIDHIAWILRALTIYLSIQQSFIETVLYDRFGFRYWG